MGGSPPRLWLRACLDKGVAAAVGGRARHSSNHTAEGLGLESCCGKKRVGALCFARPWIVIVMMGFGGDRKCGDEVWHRIHRHLHKKDIIPNPPPLPTSCVTRSVTQFFHL